MGVYMLPRRVHHKMDSTKSNFFWDSEVHKRYHMVKWDVLKNMVGWALHTPG
jgi:hypothetical protein